VLVVNVPIVIVTLIAGYFLVPNSRDSSAPHLDPLGAILSITGIAILLWAVIEGPSHGWGSASILIAFGAGALVLAGFLAWELTYSSPMLNVRFFKNPRFSAASSAITLTFLALFGVIFLLTQYLQAVQGFSRLKAGAVLVPMGMLLMVASPISARITEALGTKVVVGMGLLILTVAMLLMSRLTVTSSVAVIIGITLVQALGMSQIMAPATESIMGSLPRDKAGVGSAVNDTTRQFGGAVGVAVLGSLLSSRYTTRVEQRLAPLHPPTAVMANARDNIQKALGAAQQAPRQLARPLAAAARSSFVDGFHLATVVGAIIALAAAIGVFRFLPSRAADQAGPDGGMDPRPVADHTLTLEPVLAIDDGDVAPR
jgi:Na+/melibiose symporter-like transporter